MILKVEFAAQLRAVFGAREREVEVPDGATLATLLDRLCSESDEAATRLRGDEGELSRSVLVFLDEAQVLPGSDPVLVDGGRLLFTTPIAGG